MRYLYIKWMLLCFSLFLFFQVALEVIINLVEKRWTITNLSRMGEERGVCETCNQDTLSVRHVTKIQTWNQLYTICQTCNKETLPVFLTKLYLLNSRQTDLGCLEWCCEVGVSERYVIEMPPHHLNREMLWLSLYRYLN